ncbi:TonB-dependent receptor [Parabacteroides bouchesdurhonensis]|uniref:TonB-dependent receptor n=1 Tax=Parabacteroides bouchesdurhonensis TaxID=1936995 RepID=UPI000C827BAD|nr:TonB-dependent receptor [Parabacteroides bouchesdurhonensis]
MNFKFARTIQVLKKRQFKSIKLALFILLVSPSLFAQVTVSVQNQSIRQTIKTIESTTDYQFFYNDALSSLDNKVSLSVTNEPIEAVLDKLFANTDITYKKDNNNLIVLTLKATSNQQKGTERKVKGSVVDASGIPVIGANIVVAGTTNGTITDIDGNFSLEVPENAALHVSYIGYLDQDIKVGNNSVLNITLKEDTQKLDEVVVVGYGQQKKVSMTSSVGVIKSDAINLNAKSTVTSLQGLAPGLTIVDYGGAPGRNTTTMRVRGVTSLNDDSNDALILVDGIEQRLEDLNPADIENISILKDASATSIYGSRAANGVILVTTKRGKSGKVQINYNYYYGFQKAMNNPKHMESEAYMRQQIVAYQNAGKTGDQIPYNEEYIQEWKNATDREKYPYANVWQDVLFETAPQQNHSFSVSGGSEKFKGLMSVRYYKQDGIIPNFESNTKDFRVNTDFNPLQGLTLSLDADYRSTYSLQPSEAGEVFRTIYHASQFTTPVYSDGSYGLSKQGNNPLMYATMSGDDKKWKDLFVGNLKASYTFKDFTANFQYALRYANNKDKIFKNAYTLIDKEYPSRQKKVDRNNLLEKREDIRESTLNATLNYAKTFGKHSVSGMAGYSLIQNKTSYLEAERSDFYNNDVPSMNMGGESSMKNKGYDNEFGLQSYFMRGNYNFDDKYLLEANIRYDGSSRFTGDNQYSFFPSFSAGWRLSNESFWDGLRDLFSNVKIRGSWGKTGNQTCGLYSFYDSYSSKSYTFGGNIVNGYAQTTFANKDLKWETTTQTDIGLDLGFLNNQLTVEAEYYYKRTDGILMELTIPATVGLDAPFQNAGVVDNKGFEISVGYHGGNKFQYNLNFNISNNWNKVVSMAGSSPIITGSNSETFRIKGEGYPVNAIWGYKTDGLYQSWDEIKAGPVLDANTKPGDVKYVDTDQNKTIDADDRVYLGTELPRFPFAFSGSFKYNNFDLSILLQGVMHAETRVSGAFAEFGNYEGFVLDTFKDYWTEENTGAKWPRPQKQCDYNSNCSDFWVKNCGYLRLKNLEIGYTIPQAITQKYYIDRLRFYVSGTNLLTFSPIREFGLDPEFVSGRGNYYPQTAVYTLGVNVSF